ncbi:NADP-dependent oxidoreductase [Streptomyces sp. M2CJ-2]|uniref:NADP-dependent oxidoreductase n=1 Tax=Streptomyces sp. M2CJ-2 TaxID=2803948 RepID=UPI0027DC948A|nr:NADP-dependent oxidoreductase [Streptomyces sp. M2CJ-2]
MTMTITAQAVHQVARPSGFPSLSDFAFTEHVLDAPSPGTALVENILLSVDPYMRELMDQAGLPDGVSWWDLDAPLEGRTIGRVLTSADPSLAPGDLVLHRKGWRTHALVEASTVRVLPRYAGVPLTAYLSVLGGTGLTAYVALTRTLQLQPGEDLFVSAAAGGVGTAVGQFARLMSAGRIVGSAGSPLKVERLVKDLGFDAAFDYHDGPVSDLLTSAAPDGLDTAVENVGGDHLEAAIGSLRDFGRIAWVGAIAQYHCLDTPPPAPRNLFDVVGKSLRLEGVLVRDHKDAQSLLEDFAVPHIRSGALVPQETVVDGFENIAAAFLGALRGDNMGKMIVRAGE